MGGRNHPSVNPLDVIQNHQPKYFCGIFKLTYDVGLPLCSGSGPVWLNILILTIAEQDNWNCGQEQHTLLLQISVQLITTRLGQAVLF